MGHLMERQLDEAAGYLLRKALVDKGITVKCSANSKEILGEDGHVKALLLDDGTQLPCDLLVMAVGIRPNVKLAQDAGLAVGKGIHVDDQMVTSDTDVLAVGECVEHDGAIFGLVAPLYDQAKVAAQTLMGAQAAFVQKELSTKLKVTGCDLFSAGDFADGDGREDIVFRDPARGVYRRLVLEDDVVIGAVMYGDTADSNWSYRVTRRSVAATESAKAKSKTPLPRVPLIWAQSKQQPRPARPAGPARGLSNRCWRSRWATTSSFLPPRPSVAAPT